MTTVHSSPSESFRPPPRHMGGEGLSAEDRSWIYGKRTRVPAPRPGTLESIYEPDVEYVSEEEPAPRIRADHDEPGERVRRGLG